MKLTEAPRRILVVGNGIAGQTACDSLRAAGFDGDLTVVGDEPRAAYSRPALSKALLVDGGSHALAPPTHEAAEVLGVAAVGLDVESRRVSLDDGSDLPYDGLVIATGSRARRLGGEDSVELTLRTLDDALVLRERLAARPSVVVVGAGPLGMEIASAALSAGCRVTLVADGRPMLSHLGPCLSDAFAAAAVARGLTIVVGSAAGIDDARGVVLRDGSRVAADLLVSAIGDIPNTEWLAAGGLMTGGRLEADSRGRIGPGIVAAGDVAAVPTRTGVRRIPLWSSAIEQAKVAALALLAGDEAPELDFDPYFWTEQFGLNLKATGNLPAAGEPEFLLGDSPHGPSVMRWTHDDGHGVAVAVNHRIPIPRLRRMASAGA
ncbi:FAD-dependent pyridine nucleotide-disulfide oxidoreductase [Rhodococcus opacus PD630]|uniref:NAD(P)/FAD-dependent oxidoreductase n=1 Tax=Rhodococcus opacus TaxID=37919 RepID=UPI00029CC9CA|nr:NAD(P)/FAD-dependent oxidoreductase [Rhodococcus opacus]AHK34917.1 Rhodocoxin reductase [Rhodococcus opacus PD630]EHI39209.1 FAD-dependent pyridine nucleotide-disulfide oxidoreductase [Rhodococcus opacus PD630]UDG96998.1 NAD(P)/FAD-dependent oxidoreductase [Rhodococcus opacus PD630]